MNMWRLILITFYSLSLSAGQEYGGGQNDSLRCIRRNEEPICVKACPPEKTCRTRDIRFNCLNDNSKCVNKCVCKPGYFRNLPKVARLAGYVPGDCISNEQCDKCPGKHEYFDCGPACDNVCADLHVQNKTNCPIVNIKCNDKCYCEDGFARDDKNECIPIESCPKSSQRYRREVDKCPGPHEYFDCGPACDNVCADLHVQNKINCPIVNIKCNDKCYCEDGFARDDKNECIPIESCPKSSHRSHREVGTCKSNESFGCVKTCPPDTCNSLVAKYRCKDEPCQLQCRCKPGYLRLKVGTECIPYQQCPRT